MFPAICHLGDVEHAITNRSEFVVARRDGYIAIDYRFTKPDSFGCLVTDQGGDLELALLRRECRGIKFCAKTGRIIARPYAKSFNYRQKRETEFDAIDWSRPFVVLEKLDGSMVHPTPIGGDLIFTTAMQDDGIAAAAGDFAHASRNANYVDFCREVVAQGATPIFEFRSPRYPRVIPCAEESLVLTGMRKLVSGSIVDYDDMRQHAGPWGIPVVKAWTGPGTRDIEDIVAYVAERHGIEGCVLRFDDGTMLKIKSNLYNRLHWALDGLRFEKNAVRIVLEQRDDDLLPALPAAVSQRLAEFAGQIRQGLQDRAWEIEKYTIQKRCQIGGDRKEFARLVGNDLPTIAHPVAFAVWKGACALNELEALVLRHTGSDADLEKVRPLWGHARWRVA